MPGKDELVQALLSQGLTIDDLIKAGIVQEGEYDRVSKQKLDLQIFSLSAFIISTKDGKTTPVCTN